MACRFIFFFFTDPAPTEIYTLSLHDALPISVPQPDVPGASLSARDPGDGVRRARPRLPDRKSTRLNSSHSSISYAVFCLKKKTAKKYQGICHSHVASLSTARPS